MNFCASRFLVTIHAHTVKSFAIDRAAACSIMPREIAALQHELIRRLVGYRPPTEIRGRDEKMGIKIKDRVERVHWG